MKKKILLIVFASLLFAGVAAAASVNGDFEGSPIVKLFSNGKEIKADDVPAIIYKGRTMVPVSMLKKLGFEVKWEPDTYSVVMQSPDELIKAYNDLLYVYNVFYSLHSSLAEVRSQYMFTITQINNGIDYTNSLNNLYSSISSALDLFKTAGEEFDAIDRNNLINETDAKKATDLTTDLVKSLEYCVQAYQNLNQYLETKNLSYLSKSLEADDQALYLMTDLKKEINDESKKIHEAIQNL